MNKLITTNNVTAVSSPQTPDPWPSHFVAVNSRKNTSDPPATTLAIAPAAVPRFEKNAPIIIGTITNNPAAADTDKTAIKFNSNCANKYANTAMTGMTILPSHSWRVSFAFLSIVV